MQFFRDGEDCRDTFVGRGPDIDRPGHEADVLESAKQANHAGDVVRMIAPFQKASPDQGGVRIGLAQLETCLAIAQRDRDVFLIAPIVRLGVGLGIASERMKGFLLALGPKALPTDEGASGRKHIQADAA